MISFLQILLVYDIEQIQRSGTIRVIWKMTRTIIANDPSDQLRPIMHDQAIATILWKQNMERFVDDLMETKI